MIGAFRAESRKLLAQLSTRVLALVCVLGPLAFGAVLSAQGGVPADTLLGGWVHSSGFDVALVVLGFAGYLGFPVLAGAVAGDMFSAEDRYGTWKTILTRSRSRREVFLGKLLAAGALALALLLGAAASSMLAGVLFTGDQALVGLGGQTLSAGESLGLVAAAWALSALPLLGFVSLALLCSAASRNSIVGALGPVMAAAAMQLLGLVGKGTWMHSLLLSSAFDGWHGLLAAPRFYAPALIAVAVALAWIAACVGATWWLVGREEFGGPRLARRIGWAMPTRAVVGAAALMVVLAFASNLGATPVTAGRLEASIEPVFNRLTLLQQRELGRSAGAGSKLDLRTRCRRHGGQGSGPGDDWTCTMTLITPRPGAELFQLTPVTYDLSVKSNGCYKADAPPVFVGQRTMLDVHRNSVVNPLFTIYGCFDTTGGGPHVRSAGGRRPAGAAGAKGEGVSPGQREAEQAAGAGVVRETEESQRHLEREGEEKGPAPGR